MEEDFGVPVSEVEFFIGATESSLTKRKTKVSHSLPPGVKVHVINPAKIFLRCLKTAK